MLNYITFYSVLFFTLHFVVFFFILFHSIVLNYRRKWFLGSPGLFWF